ncbi:YifB family Mg chelatase-like AAA ATPase [Candidatus Parcubacteria bacterium]|nr:YifB family Mg chelatase-like AAA ATPase [Candidatus Parcubacteria bacterium]
MPNKVFSGTIVGLDAHLIEVQIDVSHGLRSFTIVGLPDKTVEESKERIESAIKNSKLLSPHGRTFRILVNLAPADIKKEGSLYDLPIALAFLAASKQTNFNPEGKLFLGELSLDGTLRPIKGALSFAILAQKLGFAEIILPMQNANEASLISQVKIIGVDSLGQALSYLENRTQIEPHVFQNQAPRQDQNLVDISWIKGQEYAKRALEITAAGAHNLFFLGPPGGGKSLLAKALPSILPPLHFEEALEVTKIYSVAGLLKEHETMVTNRPFRAPHHIASEAALMGGGSPLRPGEITLAHRGVLFLDEFPEFHRDALESLRQPMEEGKITISRAKHTLTLPSRFMLVAASNPCPCGYLLSPDKNCTCSPSQVAMYKRKLSGPLIDRIDIFIEVPAVKYEKLIDTAHGHESHVFKERIQQARQIQKKRLMHDGILSNSEMQIPQIKAYCQVDAQSQELLKKYVDSGKLSARGYHRVLKVARTIADLAGMENIHHDHIAEALMYRLKS